ncbi:hypothetical protein IWQ57_004619 [Coemansia nantahalensis]|uniref:Uncharacterized protein n=1 Tax=Coemansia nantahalensis TaxID=2789366 RepID=A0ACC1JRE5_9FUNG|nr:hypothetical protein IWQ57_004619 [Coemansia nantahalensis]
MIRMLLCAPAVLLALLLLVASPVYGQQGGACTEGSRQCQAQDRTSPFYYRCTNGRWTLYTCGNGYTCSTGGAGGATCVQNTPTPPPVCVEGQRRCASSGNPSLYYRCTGGAWTLYTCGNGYRCSQTSPLQATCTAVPQCASGSQVCVGAQNPGLYFSCVNGAWSQKSCNPGDRCINIPGGIVNCQVGGARRTVHH